jgi:hypothetical protein
MMMMPSDEASNTLAHSLEHVDGREGGQHRVAALELQPARREHGPRRFDAAFPAHLEFVHRAAVGQALEKARPHARLQSHPPGVAAAPAQPGAGRGVGVQHLVFGHRGDHHGNRERLHQLALGGSGARAGGQFLLQQAFAVELRQHLVEGGDQAPDLVAAVPLGAPAVVTAAAHVIGHAGQVAQGLGDLARHQVDQAQDAGQQQQGRAQVQPHAGVQAIDPGVQQTVERMQANLPGLAQVLQQQVVLHLQGRTVALQRAFGGHGLHQRLKTLRVVAQRLA